MKYYYSVQIWTSCLNFFKIGGPTAPLILLLNSSWNISPRDESSPTVSNASSLTQSPLKITTSSTFSIFVSRQTSSTAVQQTSFGNDWISFGKRMSQKFKKNKNFKVQLSLTSMSRDIIACIHSQMRFNTLPYEVHLMFKLDSTRKKMWCSCLSCWITDVRGKLIIQCIRPI